MRAGAALPKTFRLQADRLTEYRQLGARFAEWRAVPGIVFPSGGQSAEETTDNRNAMIAMGAQPWQASFSYGRALQAPVLAAWKGVEANAAAAQKALQKRCRLNGLARDWAYARSMDAEA